MIPQEDEDDLELTAEQEARLLKAIEKANGGDFIDGDSILKELTNECDSVTTFHQRPSAHGPGER